MKAIGPHNFFKTEWRNLVLLLAMCLIYFFSYFHRVAVPGTCFDELQRDFKASAAAITARGSLRHFGHRRLLYPRNQGSICRQHYYVRCAGRRLTQSASDLIILRLNMEDL